jgi:hypothetical protein
VAASGSGSAGIRSSVTTAYFPACRRVELLRDAHVPWVDQFPPDGEPWTRMSELDGTWSVRRISGLLPPLLGVNKRIEDGHGDTRLGPLRVPFVVEGYSLRYCKPFYGFVDVLESDGERIRGRATFRGREFGQFEMHRV